MGKVHRVRVYNNSKNNSLGSARRGRSKRELMNPSPVLKRPAGQPRGGSAQPGIDRDSGRLDLLKYNLNSIKLKPRRSNFNYISVDLGWVKVKLPLNLTVL
jgi:hypothetical protein